MVPFYIASHMYCINGFLSTPRIKCISLIFKRMFSTAFWYSKISTLSLSVQQTLAIDVVKRARLVCLAVDMTTTFEWSDEALDAYLRRLNKKTSLGVVRLVFLVASTGSEYGWKSFSLMTFYTFVTGLHCSSDEHLEHLFTNTNQSGGTY